MKRHSGFTLIEMMIAVTIMVILLTLAVVVVSSSRSDARDKERQGDVANIARFLEGYYQNGPKGSSYPSTIDINSSNIESTFADFELDNLKAPRQDSYSLIPATNNNETNNGVRPLPTVDQYVYQPLADSSYDMGVTRYCAGYSSVCGVCDNSIMKCRKFNIFYRTESDNQVHKVTSKIQ